MAGQPIALVVEDEDEWVEILKEALGPRFDIVVAKSIPEVRKILKKNMGNIEVALVDILLQEHLLKKASGIDVMYILNQESIPCIAATVHNDGETIREALVQGGAKDVWFKTNDKLITLRKKIDSIINYKNNALSHQSGLVIKPSFPPVKEGTDPKLVFVLMPFSEEWSDDYQHVVKSVGKKHKLNVVRADDIFGPRKIINDIWQSINKAGIIIADISIHNANVFYELGIAHTLGKPVILTRKKDGEKSPFDIASWRYLEFELNPVNVDNFVEALSKEFKEYIAENNIS